MLRGAEGAHASSLDRYRCVDLESYYANVDKYPKYMNLPSASTSRKAVKNDQPSLREHLENRLESQAKRHASESLYNNILTYMPLPRTNNLNIPAKPAPTLSKKRKSKIRGTPAYKSIRDAAKSKRLFHSVRQQPLCVEAVENGADSDADLEEEVKWRLKMCDDEIEDYCDTIPVEKLFMNLWNQFVRVDVVFKADRVMADNCMRFAKSA